MRHFYLILLLLPTLALAQRSKDKPLLFNKGKQVMPVGAYYYPEHWSPSQWDRDLAKQAELGFTFTHMGEFAWDKMEPQPGKFDFAWLDRAVDLATRHKLKVILCTPSATPPVWLQRSRPEAIVVSWNGRTMDVGNRRHGSCHSRVYRNYCNRITKELAKRYGDNATVIGWQLDNEPHTAGGGYDYSPVADSAFRVWVKAKYKNNLDTLNKHWGTAFWGMTYSDWAQIRVPNRTLGDVNNHAKLDFQRFTSEQTAEFLGEQADILHAGTSNQFVTTNYAYEHFLPEVNPFQTRKKLDFASYTMYLLSQRLEQDKGPLAYRLGSGMELSYTAEFSKSVGPQTGIMELQPGQINWGPFNPIPQPGAVRMWMWHVYGLGSDFICTYRFRQPLYGGEQYHHGIMETDGITVGRGGKEYSETAKEFERVATYVKPNTPLPPTELGRRTAVFWSQESMLDIAIEPWNEKFDYWQQVYRVYAAAKAAGALVTFFEPGQTVDPAQYPVAVVPSFQIATQKQVDIWRDYVAKGGRLLITCRTAQKTPDGHFYQARIGALLAPLTGADIEDIDQLPKDQPGTVSGFGKPDHAFHIWGELLVPRPALKDSVKAVATYAGDVFYKGRAAAVQRSLGKGSLIYVGAYSTDGSLEKAALRELYKQAGAQDMDLPPYVFHNYRDGLHVMVNYSSQDYRHNISATRRILGNDALEPGGVLVYTE